VVIFAPGQTDAAARIAAVFQAQERAQFGTGRFAFLFKPGRYDFEVPVGFYTQVAGLGRHPGDVMIAGQVGTDAAWMHHNATCNFWRAAENFTIAPPGGINVWAVSQAAPLRRAHIRGELQLSSRGGSSGGFMADCRVDGAVRAGSQQQWFSRHSTWQSWFGLNWNMVFIGCENAPAGEWPAAAVTRIERAPVVREKPYLVWDDGRWGVQVPPLRREPAAGATWPDGGPVGAPVPLSGYHLAKAGVDTATSLNQALRAGKHVLFTPGHYSLDDTLVVSRSNAVLLGLGFPTLVPANGRAALRVEAVEGVIVSGLVVDAGATESPVLVQFGLPGQQTGRAENPHWIHDLVCRVGGYGLGKVKAMVAIHGDHVVGDNLWLWRADHGTNVGWTENTCDTGLQVEGADVTVYGLFVEHTQKHQVVWNGERGRVFFYQSEMPYDPPAPEAWRSPTGAGYASYKVGTKVRAHEAHALGVYHYFRDAAVVADRAIEAPDGPGIRLRHLFTFRLDGGKPGSGIRHVLNDQGGEVIVGRKATLD
jgi:hypothetical protein